MSGGDPRRPGVVAKPTEFTEFADTVAKNGLDWLVACEGKGRIYDPAVVEACTALFRQNRFTLG